IAFSLSGTVFPQEFVPWTFETYDSWVPWEKVTEVERQKWNEEYNKKDLYVNSGMVTDTSKQFLDVPDALKAEWPEGMEIAVTPPTIEFAPVRGIDPMYFPENNKSLWSNWAGVIPAVNGKFYFFEGDHRAQNSHIYMWEYDPEAHDYTRVIDFATLCGWYERGVGDSKIHGEPGIMPDGTMWILTYWDPDPKPTMEQYNTWPGSHLVKYNIHTDRAKDMGVLIPKCGWPEFRLDTHRGKLFAVGFRNEVLCYDVNEERVTYCGYPPAGIVWDNRCSLLDPDTGLFWCRALDGSNQLVSFDPQTNLFTKYEETSPYRLRTYTHKRNEDGSFWVTTKGSGHIFKFWPDSRRVELITNQWNNQGYCPRIAMSEDWKYIYYMAGIDYKDDKEEYRYQPVVQFNTVTNKRKVIAFVTDYYFKKYGYVMMIPFGMGLSKDGSTLVINLNGAFKPRIQPFYGNPALMVVHIPKNERE
ncbi:MAG: hypothetical protein JXB48_18135, partial [Candidatus Latescibacteria bacterium]|nr:hypothetical protein [Candidatus Latescibacterota bacterium]